MDCNVLSAIILIVFLVIVFWILGGIAFNDFKQSAYVLLITIGCAIAFALAVYFFIEILPPLLCAWNICKCV